MYVKFRVLTKIDLCGWQSAKSSSPRLPYPAVIPCNAYVNVRKYVLWEASFKVASLWNVNRAAKQC